MKFVKNYFKRHLKDLEKLGTADAPSFVRSNYGVVPCKEGFADEKINGLASIFSEHKIRSTIARLVPKESRGILEKRSREILKDHFDLISDENYDEHCLVVRFSADTTEESIIAYDTEALESFIHKEPFMLMVVIHFLPYMARDYYRETVNNNYNIAYSNKFSFDGYSFQATLRPTSGVSSFGSFDSAISAYDQKMAKDYEILLDKFDKVETIYEQRFGQRSVSGFKVYFEKFNRINLLKIIKLNIPVQVHVKASLKSMGQYKEEKQ